MIYMRAHGSSPGPSEKPFLAGSVAGAIAVVAPLAILSLSRAAAEIGRSLGFSPWSVLLLVGTVATVSGGIYARVFGRGANDASGGWLFGLAFGFLVWMLGPTVLLQALVGGPLATGRAGQAALGAHLLWGLSLGLLLPAIHRRFVGHPGSTGRESIDGSRK